VPSRRRRAEGGNISVRAGDIVAITPSGIRYDEMRPGHVRLVKLDAFLPPELGAGHPRIGLAEAGRG
jgi:ribulose-5-phosphate 4-epimerase/fuculose-1-phosphate aldolase